MLKYIFLSLLIIASTNSQPNHYNMTYNITWNQTYTNQVGIILETHINNTWVSPQKNGTDYLSLVLNAIPNYFVWHVSDDFISRFWKNGNRIRVLNYTDSKLSTIKNIYINKSFPI